MSRCVDVTILLPDVFGESKLMCINIAVVTYLDVYHIPFKKFCTILLFVHPFYSMIVTQAAGFVK
jgi:hypothetical protein